MKPSKSARLFALMGLAALASAPPVGAQQIWRCGPDGRVFSDRPCVEGQLLAASTAGQRRSDEDLSAARALADRERQLADTLASEREARAQVPPGSGLIGIGPTAAERERELRRAKRQNLLERQKARYPSAPDTSATAARASRRVRD